MKVFRQQTKELQDKESPRSNAAIHPIYQEVLCASQPLWLYQTALASAHETPKLSSVNNNDHTKKKKKEERKEKAIPFRV